MSVGYPTSKADIDSRAGNLAMQLRDLFAQIGSFEGWLATQTEQNLTDRGYTSGEVAILKSAYSELNTLRTIYEGAAALETPYDFRTFAKQLTGVI